MYHDNRMDSPKTMTGAIAAYKPVKIYALYSGGHDSFVSTHFAMNHGAQEVLHLRTMIGIKKTFEIVQENCRIQGWPLRVEKPPKLDYLAMCAKYGVPGPGAHKYAYIWLKERALDKVVRESKTHRLSRVMLVTGVRQSESARRMGYVVPLHRDGCSVWLAPCFDWTDTDIEDYMEDHCLPKSPIKEILGMSGECCCGAFGDRGREFPIIQQLDPECAEQILVAEAVAKDANKPCEWARARKVRKQSKPKFMPLCVGCETAIARGRHRSRANNPPEIMNEARTAEESKEAHRIVEIAFEENWVVQDCLDAIDTIQHRAALGKAEEGKP